MKVTVNACRKKRVKVDVNAVTSRKDVVRLPVRAVAAAEDKPEIKEKTVRSVRSSSDIDQLDLSAVFSSAVFERAEEQEKKSALPEIFVEPVRQLNKLADTRPEPDELPVFFDTRDMSAEEEARAYSDPVRLVDGTEPAEEEPEDTAAENEPEPIAETAPEEYIKVDNNSANEKRSKSQKATKKKPAPQPPEENYTTEELLAIIERQQQEKKQRDLELAELKRARDEERAMRAEQERIKAQNRQPAPEERSRREDTLFMWWSELDARDDTPSEPDSEETFTQMQITEDIPARRPRAAAAETEAVKDASEIASAVDLIAEFAADDDGVYAQTSEEAGYEAFSGDDDADDYGEISFDGVDADDDDYGEVSFESADDYGDYNEAEFECGDYGDYDEAEFDGEEEDESDTSVNVRYFDRDNEGERVEVDRSEAVGQEVVVIDNESGKMKRICGIIKRGAAAQPSEQAAGEDGGTDE